MISQLEVILNNEILNLLYVIVLDVLVIFNSNSLHYVQ